MFEIVGKTEGEQLVISGVYRFLETHGIPLDVLLERLRESKVVPCWLSFYDEAVGNGMKHNRILSKLDPALCDVYGRDFKDAVLEKLRTLRGSKRLG